MGAEDQPDRDRAARDRIAAFMRSEKSRTRDADEKEVESLKTAVKRLDRWLVRATEAEHETLRAATARLDQWLQALPKGKASRPNRKRQKDNENSPK